jgi:hypothetical protein
MVHEDKGYEYMHTPGVIAMRMMQLAAQEQPVPHIEYVSPLLATYDMTLSPFMHDGVSAEVIDQIGYRETAISRLFTKKENPNNLSPEHLRLFTKMENHPERFAFSSSAQAVLRRQTRTLTKWVDKKVAQVDELSTFHYNSSDTSVDQSVVSIEGLYDVFTYFTQRGESRVNKSEFEKALLQSLALVEIGIGSKNIPYEDNA